MRHDDKIYRQIARLHATSINQGFLVTLGENFLTLLYRAIDDSQDTVLLVECEEGEVTGFVSGGVGLGPIYRSLLARPLELTQALAPVLLSPRKMLGIFEVMRHGQDGYGLKDLPSHELFSIAVAPESRGKGRADRLYSDLCSYFRCKGIRSFRIVVGEDLSAAHRFYLRVGARLTGETNVHGSASSSVYVQTISDSDEH